MPATPAPKKTRRHAGLKRLLLIGVGTFMALLALEVAMIVFEPYLPANGEWVYDADLGFRMKPNFRGSNEFGFNDIDYPLKKPTGTTRILFLGDSFNWCGDRGRNYVDIVRKLIRRNFRDEKIDVINAGYPMTHPGEALVTLRKWALRYEPDIVILNFFAGNDFHNGERHRKRIVLNDCFYDIDRRSELHLFGYPMVWRSRLWTFLAQKLHIAQSLSERTFLPPRTTPANMDAEAQIGLESPVGVTDLETYLDFIVRRCPRDRLRGNVFSAEGRVAHAANVLGFCSNALPDQERYADNVDYILSRITEMVALLRSRGIAFAVGMVPAQVQVSPSMREKVLKRLRWSEDSYVLDRPQRILGTYLLDRKIPFVDFLPYLQRANQKRETYYPNDTHLNNFGNDVIGQVYYALFVERYVTNRR